MIDGRDLAELARLAGAPAARSQVRLVYGTVQSYSAGNLRVRPDGMPSGDVGPLFRLASYGTPAASHRVAMLYNPDSKTYLVIGQIVNT